MDEANKYLRSQIFSADSELLKNRHYTLFTVVGHLPGHGLGVRQRAGFYMEISASDINVFRV